MKLPVQWNVAFFGQHDLKGSLKWMGTFWVSIAGVLWGPACRRSVGRSLWMCSDLRKSA